jgi:hypothetical protein
VNRQVLLGGVKTARSKPFRVVQNGRRVVVVGADVPESRVAELLSKQ